MTRRCGVDLVELARFERFFANCDPGQVRTIFSESEVRDCEAKPAPLQSFAARFAVKEACLKLFPRETALHELEHGDIEVGLDGYGAPVILAAGRLAEVLRRYDASGIAVSMTHTPAYACGVAIAE